MVARRPNALAVIFAPEVAQLLEASPDALRDEVLDLCGELAELAAISPLQTTPFALPRLSSATRHFEVTYDVDPFDHALRITALRRRS